MSKNNNGSWPSCQTFSFKFFEVHRRPKPHTQYWMNICELWLIKKKDKTKQNKTKQKTNKQTNKKQNKKLHE